MKSEQRQLYTRRGEILVIITILVSITALVVANYYTLKISHAIRAYISGESIYTRHEKGAALNLTYYLHSGDPAYYRSFQEQLAVVEADNSALDAMKAGDERSIAHDFLIKGKNHPEDVDNLIWLSYTLGSFDFMKQALDDWNSAAIEIEKYLGVGEEIHRALQSPGTLDHQTRMEYMQRINTISDRVSLEEASFADTLSMAAIRVRIALFWINVVLLVVIFGSIYYVYRSVLRSFRKFRKDLETKNRKLENTNRKLDKFIYAASHELKAPVSNIEGLMNLTAMDPEGISPYQKDLQTKMMVSLSTLSNTLADIEDMVRLEKEPFADYENIDVEELIEEILVKNHLLENVPDVIVKTKIRAKSIWFSRKGFQSIISNLVFNSFQYRQMDRRLELSIATEEDDSEFRITVSDNGSGIDLGKHKEALFEMFTRFHGHSPGAGLGLYQVKRIVDRNGGDIQIKSDIGEGTVVSISLKKQAALVEV